MGDKQISTHIHGGWMNKYTCMGDRCTCTHTLVTDKQAWEGDL